MAIWIVRAGKQGQLEQQFLEDGRAYLTFGHEDATWKGLSREEIVQRLEKGEWGANLNRNRNFAGQINAFVNRIKKGDTVVLPSKMAPTIHFGQVVAEYQWNPNEPIPHAMEIDWTDKDIPRDRFDQDILYSLGAFLTVCQVKRNDAEARIAEMKANNWFVPKSVGAIPTTEDDDYEDESVDVETYTRDQISKHLIRKFKGHGMERLIAEILTARGYEVYQSPKGADKGVDLLAASGEFGFGGQKILVQVKTQDDPIGIDIVDRLVGTMRNYNAENAILVSWSGIKNSVEAEKKSKFFEVRFWDRDDIIDELLRHYDKLSDQLRAEVPLKRIWTLTDQDCEMVGKNWTQNGGVLNCKRCPEPEENSAQPSRRKWRLKPSRSNARSQNLPKSSRSIPTKSANGNGSFWSEVPKFSKATKNKQKKSNAWNLNSAWLTSALAA